MKFDIAIARFPGGGSERHELTDWLISTVITMKQDERIGKIFRLKYPGDTPITMLRNRCIVEAKRCGAQYLLMADADMAPDLYPQAPKFWDTAWSFMMARREDEALCDKTYAAAFGNDSGRFAPATIAAPYCGPPPDELPYVFGWVNSESHNPNPDWKLKLMPRELAAVLGGIQQMDALATGLILYDMRVFDMLKPPWYRYEYSDETESQRVTTEDVFQTRNAGMLGLPQYCAFDCWAGHAKGKVVGKPIIITRERVAEAYREAIKRGIAGDQRIMVLPDGPSSADAVMAADWNPPDEKLPPGYEIHPSKTIPGVMVHTFDLPPDEPVPFVMKEPLDNIKGLFVARNASNEDIKPPPFMAVEAVEDEEAFPDHWPEAAKDKP